MSDDDSGWGGIADEYKDRRDSDDTAETGETKETTETMGTTETTTSSETSGTKGTPTTTKTSETNIKDEWNGRTIYLPDDVVDDLDLRFDELALEAKRAGDGIKKNRDFYPALVRAALNETSIEKELGLESD